MGNRKSLYSRLAHRLREVGLVYTLYLIVQRLSSPYFFQFQRLFIIAQPLDACDLDTPDDPHIRAAMPDEAARITNLGYPIEDVETQFKRGDRCWVFDRDGSLLACDWVRRSAQDGFGWIVLGKKPDDVWSAGIVVKPGSRGQGIASLLRSHVIRQCARGGTRRMLGTIDTPNHNSIRAMNRVGYGPVGILFYVRIFGLAAVRAGKRWQWGTWDMASPLTLSLADIEDPSSLSEWNAVTGAGHALG